MVHDESVEDDEGEVGDDLHEDHLAPEGVEGGVDGVLGEVAPPHAHLRREGEHVLLDLEEL